MFLVTIRANPSANSVFREGQDSFRTHFGVLHVRGCEVSDLIGPDGKTMDEFTMHKNRPQYRNHKRTLRILLDPNQYQTDVSETQQSGSEDIYGTFNLLVRRKPQENNFKAVCYYFRTFWSPGFSFSSIFLFCPSLGFQVLETIRDLMQSDCTVPEWLHDIFLGYGDPGAAHYSLMPNKLKTIDFNDTFVDYEHLEKSFPGVKVSAKSDDVPSKIPPAKVTFAEEGDSKTAEVSTYEPPNRGPYPENKPKRNAVPFTPTQVEAIKSGVNPGLTMVVGPPGTGKTDVAVQIVSNLYHNFPEQHTLLITHSNQGLNQIFEKIINLDIDERHCLRLGHGVEEVETEKDFSKYGRVDNFLTKRVSLLGEVDKLAKRYWTHMPLLSFFLSFLTLSVYSLTITGDHAYTCETAGHFFLFHIVSRWEKFQEELSQSKKGGLGGQRLKMFEAERAFLLLFFFFFLFRSRSHLTERIGCRCSLSIHGVLC